MAMANLRGERNLELTEFNGTVEEHLAPTMALLSLVAGTGTPPDLTRNRRIITDISLIILGITWRREEKAKERTQDDKLRDLNAATQSQPRARNPALTSPMRNARRACILVARGLGKLLRETESLHDHCLSMRSPARATEATPPRRQDESGYLEVRSPALTSPTHLARRAWIRVALETDRDVA